MSRRSFTLVEVLAALALTGLVVTLTSRITMHLVQVREKVTQVVGRLEREALLFETLDTDLKNMVFEMPGADSPIKVFGTPLPTLELTALATWPNADSLHVPWYPSTVRYRLLPEEGDGGMNLVRETFDRTSPRASRETLANGLEEFTIQVRAQNQWLTEFPAQNRHLAAKAIRVHCRWSQEQFTRTLLLGKP